jgi:uncharacterized FlaG/YvyC family protein
MPQLPGQTAPQQSPYLALERAEGANGADAAGPEDTDAAETNDINEAKDINGDTKSLRDYLESVPSEMNFSYDQEAGRPIFRLVNPVTGEVLKQFPPDEFLTMIKRLRGVSDAFSDGGALMDVRL